MTVPFVVPAYAAILALVYIYLALHVSRLRGSTGIGLGGGNVRLDRAIRAHGNFGEYVPLALVLLGFAEMQRNSVYLLHLLCVLLVLGRLVHAVGISRPKGDTVPRTIGMTLTFLVLAITAVILLYDYVRLAPL